MADADSNQEAAFFVKQLKEFVGLGDIDDTAQWVAMTYNDVRRRRVSRRGAVALSVEILPPEEAEDRPAGQGRSEPNANPFLPPTTGRMSLSYNPLAIVSALLGPRLAFQLLCCLCCVLLLVVMGILGMYFTSVRSQARGQVRVPLLFHVTGGGRVDASGAVGREEGRPVPCPVRRRDRPSRHGPGEREARARGVDERRAQAAAPPRREDPDRGHAHRAGGAGDGLDEAQPDRAAPRDGDVRGRRVVLAPAAVVGRRAEVARGRAPRLAHDGPQAPRVRRPDLDDARAVVDVGRDARVGALEARRRRAAPEGVAAPRVRRLVRRVADDVEQPAAGALRAAPERPLAEVEERLRGPLLLRRRRSRSLPALRRRRLYVAGRAAAGAEGGSAHTGWLPVRCPF